MRNLRIDFAGRRGTVTAIHDVSLEIARGEILGVVGESGAGKSLTGAAVIGSSDRRAGWRAERSTLQAGASTRYRNASGDACAAGGSARSSRIRSPRSTR